MPNSSSLVLVEPDDDIVDALVAALRRHQVHVPIVRKHTPPEAMALLQEQKQRVQHRSPHTHPAVLVNPGLPGALDFIEAVRTDQCLHHAALFVIGSPESATTWMGEARQRVLGRIDVAAPDEGCRQLRLLLECYQVIEGD